ncbi:MAG: hypothetical protein Q7T93_04365 [Methylobacterium sp.]|uniref:hypothetical protein n=1 Tax=Methylobacterium sp. TaxID=409 RepID=UPI002721D307|nr:hypothetical protein [Methylobacterium sp.]MDO9426044.1 hypothetical protein [Methylobacterium sp.]
MTGSASRRGFLSGLATLPLIGGSVALIGTPSAAAVPVTDGRLDAYSEWLFMERRLLCLEQHPGFDQADRFVPANTGAKDFHFPDFPTRWQDLPQPSTRAALVLSAVGCGWREGRL